MKRLFGTDGIREIADELISDNFAEKVGLALALMLKENQCATSGVIIGEDTRISSPKIRDAIAKGINIGGMDAISLGVCPTPAVAYLAKEYGYAAGVMISASHNPYSYNGIKIFGKDGFKIPQKCEERIEEIIENEEFSEAINKGKTTVKKEEVKKYIDYLASNFKELLCGLRIGIDCANGSCVATAKELFNSLGAECVIIADEPNGKNINEGCGSTDLTQIKKLVIKKKLDIGIAFDGDGDRCIAVDENGREIDGDHILAILGSWLKEEKRLDNNAIVGTVMSNMGLSKFCEKNGIDFASTKVGDRFVLEHMVENGFVLGGEQSGHIILSQYATTGDGQLTALALLNRLKKSGKSLSALADIMKKYPQYLTNIEADLSDKQAIYSDEEIKKIIIHGEKMLEKSGRLIIRPSGTEKLVRIMAEGEDFYAIKNICDEIAKSIKDRMIALKSAVRQ